MGNILIQVKTVIGCFHYNQNMDKRLLSILVVFIALLCVAFAGCTSSEPASGTEENMIYSSVSMTHTRPFQELTKMEMQPDLMLNP